MTEKFELIVTIALEFSAEYEIYKKISKYVYKQKKTNHGLIE